ncbi:hypothetical protein B4923_02020 [Brenneria roseae subsp. americana]|uniref:Uncharacterized protein n=1 Tax=Brenneria roseae subsp. americana TaxID=1508507 RepID=A0A2U1TZJ9_9GAMM|nr:hypothetical protein B4923_02020 [Brenneria roseae subsp. americana]
MSQLFHEYTLWVSLSLYLTGMNVTFIAILVTDLVTDQFFPDAISARSGCVGMLCMFTLLVKYIIYFGFI